MKRRNLKQLEQIIEKASTTEEQASAYYQVGLFHDNNAREAEAIPNYEKAIQLGLDRETKAKALAWLASSLYKTDRPKQGLQKAQESLGITNDPKLRKFLLGLEKRIKKVL